MRVIGFALFFCLYCFNVLVTRISPKESPPPSKIYYICHENTPRIRRQSDDEANNIYEDENIYISFMYKLSFICNHFPILQHKIWEAFNLHFCR